MAYTLQDIGDMVKNFDAKLDALKKTMDENISALKTEVYQQMGQLQTNVNSELSLTNAHLNDCDNRLHELEKLAIKNDIIISGIPKMEKENVYQYLENICNVIGSKFSTSLFANAFRIPSDMPIPPIIAKFDSTMSKAEFLTKYKSTKKLSLISIGFSSINDSNIYINHCLTKQCRSFRNMAKQMVTNGRLAKLQIVRGDLYITKLGETSHTRITTLDQLRNF